MNTYICPDILIKSSEETQIFASSQNLIYAMNSENGSKLIFDNRELIHTNSSIKKLSKTLCFKGFMTVGERILFKLDNLKGIVLEDFTFYLMLRNAKRIHITKKEADSVVSLLSR